LCGPHGWDFPALENLFSSLAGAYGASVLLFWKRFHARTGGERFDFAFFLSQCGMEIYTLPQALSHTLRPARPGQMIRGRAVMEVFMSVRYRTLVPELFRDNCRVHVNLDVSLLS